MKKILTIAAACVALVACNEKFIASPVNDGFGYLDINLSTNDDIVVSTKAEEATTPKNLTEEEAKDYLLTLNNGTSDTWKNKKYSDIQPADKFLAAGTYTLAAENITAEAAETGAGAIRIYGISNAFTIEKDKTTPVTVSCSVVNSAVTVAFDESFKSYFTENSYSVKISKGERSFNTAIETGETQATLTAGHEDANRKFFNLESSTENNVLTCVITATLIGESTAKTFTSSVNLAKATWHKLTFKASSDKGQIGVITISVDETLTLAEKDVTIDPISPDTTPEESAE